MLNHSNNIDRSFFERHPRIVARELLDKLLIRRDARGKFRAGRIVETEAYPANDPAAHTFNGKTARNAVIFGPAGHAYVYFTYGMHYCMNVSCEPEGKAGCVLLRALEPVEGLPAMAKSRGVELSSAPTQYELRSLTSGPARLCAALGITRERDNGSDLLGAQSTLILA